MFFKLRRTKDSHFFLREIVLQQSEIILSASMAKKGRSLLFIEKFIYFFFANKNNLLSRYALPGVAGQWGLTPPLTF